MLSTCQCYNAVVLGEYYEIHCILFILQSPAPPIHESVGFSYCRASMPDAWRLKKAPVEETHEVVHLWRSTGHIPVLRLFNVPRQMYYLATLAAGISGEERQQRKRPISKGLLKSSRPEVIVGLPIYLASDRCVDRLRWISKKGINDVTVFWIKFNQVNLRSSGGMGVQVAYSVVLYDRFKLRQSTIDRN